MKFDLNRDCSYRLMLIPLSSVLVEPPPKRPCQEICAPLSAQWDRLLYNQVGCDTTLPNKTDVLKLLDHLDTCN
jgi:hypothetical protein